jgi:hypothetical protein
MVDIEKFKTTLSEKNDESKQNNEKIASLNAELELQKKQNDELVS